MDEELTTGDIPVSNVLKEAKDLQSAIVIGTDADGQFYFASSLGDDAEVQNLLQQAQDSFQGAPQEEPDSQLQDRLFGR